VLLAQVEVDPPAAAEPEAKPETEPLADPDARSDATSDAKTNAKPAAPVRIARQADGRLVITSEDTEALDLLEDMIGEMAPPRKDYKTFRLKYAWAYGIASNLEDFFKEEDEKNSRPRYYYDYWDYRPEQKTKEAARLSKRRPLKFISDSDTNSILVQGATPEQLRQIEELIKFYDTPEPTDSQNIRKTEIIPMRYSKAQVIAEAVKEVYRDLLSSKDKAFADKKDQQRPESRYTYIYGGEGDEKQTEQAPRFKGLLSIGVDEHSNTLIVSAPTCLFTPVVEMIQKLDEAAKPVGDVRVVKVGGGVSAERLQQALSGISQEGTSGTKPPEGEPKPKTPPGAPPKPNSTAAPAAE
jgi:type II secretory pathway component GspD/PulD (secretin)